MSTKTKGEKLNTKPDGAKSVESKPDMKKERNLAFDIIRILAIQRDGPDVVASNDLCFV